MPQNLSKKTQAIIGLTAICSAILFIDGTQKPIDRYKNLLNPESPGSDDLIKTLTWLIPISAAVTNSFFNYSAFKDFYLQNSCETLCKPSTLGKLLTGFAGILPFWWIAFNHESSDIQLLSTISALLNVPINMVGLESFENTLTNISYLFTNENHSLSGYTYSLLTFIISFCLIFQNFGFAYESAMALLDSTSNMPKAISYALTAIGVLAHCIPGLGFTLKGCVKVKKTLNTHSANQLPWSHCILKFAIVFFSLFSGFLGDQANYECFAKIWPAMALAAGVIGNLGTVAYNCAEAVNAVGNANPEADVNPDQLEDSAYMSINSPA